MSVHTATSSCVMFGLTIQFVGFNLAPGLHSFARIGNSVYSNIFVIQGQLPRLYHCTEVRLLVGDKAEVGALCFSMGEHHLCCLRYLTTVQAYLLGSTNICRMCLVLRDTASSHFSTGKPLLDFPIVFYLVLVM